MKTILSIAAIPGLLCAASLQSQEAKPNKSSSDAAPLFDGTDFEGWILADDSWEITEDDAMVCKMETVEDKKTGKEKPRALGDIFTEKEYSDFELTLSYKLSEGANSGVFYRSDMKNKVQGGFEIQLMDNVGFQKVYGEKDARKLNGSFYDCLAPSSDPQNPIGEWNTLTLKCDGPMISLKINGVETFSVNVDDWDTAGKNPDGTTNKFKTAMKDLPRKGNIGFQNHGQVVWFKNVKIREIN